jgi:hypothetical protein
MGSIWTVAPETVRVECEWNGHAFWLEVKRELTEGERRRVQMAGFKGMSGFGTTPQRPGEKRDTTMEIDWLAQSYTRTLTWVVDWSLADEKAVKLALTRDTLEALHPDVYGAIETALNAHVEQQEQEKKRPAGKAKPKAISA